MRRVAAAVLVVAGVIRAAGTAALPQRPMVDAPPPSTLAFEVASVKRNTLTREQSGGFGIRGMSPSGHYEARYVRLPQLIQIAYELRDFQVIGGPQWIREDRFDIAARAPDPFDPRHTNAMLRHLLEERFRLKVHADRRRMPTYSLVTNGSRGRRATGLRASSATCESFPPRASAMARQPAPQSECTPTFGFGLGSIFMRRSPLGRLASLLSREVGRPVIDKSGLDGTYDVDLKWPVEPRPESADVFAPDPDAVAIFTAIREQLGLKLEPNNDDVDVLVIDSVEQPTPD